jgi:hypothetical protein
MQLAPPTHTNRMADLLLALPVVITLETATPTATKVTP